MTTLIFSDQTAYRYLRQGLENHADEPLLTFMGHSLSGRQIDGAIRHMAAFLATELGVSAEDTVTLCMPNVPAGVIALYAINFLGAVASVLHPLTPATAIVDNMRMTGSRVLIAFDKLFAMQCAALGHADIRIALLGAGEYCHALTRFVRSAYNRCLPAKLRRLAADHGCAIWLYDWRKSYAFVPEGARHSKDDCLILHSGGTTGVAKSIVIGNKALNDSSRGIIGLTHDPVPRQESMLMVLPLFHAFGIGVCLHGVMPYGIRVVLVPAFRPRKIVRLMAAEHITYLAGVPAMYEKMLDTGLLKGRRFAGLINAYCGGDRLDDKLKLRFDRVMQQAGSVCRLYQGYGLTESVSVCCANSPHHPDKLGSIGQPMLGVEMCIMDEQGNTVPDMEHGEIGIAGDTLMSRYWDGDEQDVFWLKEGKRWLRTGDIGYRDEQGYFYFVGRKKRMSVISGVNVYHQEVELYALQVEGVAKAAAVERTVNGKTIVCLWVQAVAGADKENVAQSIRQHLSAHMTKYCVPRYIGFVDSMPQTPMGKVDYQALGNAEV